MHRKKFLPGCLVEITSAFHDFPIMPRTPTSGNNFVLMKTRISTSCIGIYVNQHEGFRGQLHLIITNHGLLWFSNVDVLIDEP